MWTKSVVEQRRGIGGGGYKREGRKQLGSAVERTEAGHLEELKRGREGERGYARVRVSQGTSRNPGGVFCGIGVYLSV